jgi:hypothetical protein
MRNSSQPGPLLVRAAGRAGHEGTTSADCGPSMLRPIRDRDRCTLRALSRSLAMKPFSERTVRTGGPGTAPGKADSSPGDPRVLTALVGIVAIAILVRAVAIGSRLHVDDAYSWWVASAPSAGGVSASACCDRELAASVLPNPDAVYEWRTGCAAATSDRPRSNHERSGVSSAACAFRHTRRVGDRADGCRSPVPRHGLGSCPPWCLTSSGEALPRRASRQSRSSCGSCPLASISSSKASRHRRSSTRPVTPEREKAPSTPGWLRGNCQARQRCSFARTSTLSSSVPMGETRKQAKRSSTVTQ